MFLDVWIIKKLKNAKYFSTGFSLKICQNAIIKLQLKL